MTFTGGPPEHRRRRVGTAAFYSPLRYPGGKRKLANFMALLYRTNGLLDGEYAEVYAGGAAVALTLLYGDYATRVHINDLDPGLFAFWTSARDQTAALARLVHGAKLDLDEWKHQRAVQFGTDPDPLELGFSTFYLNRTNRSGIITGGVIGGKNQTGEWKIDARYNTKDLVRRIERIGRWASRIEIYRLDGAEFLRSVAPTLPEKSLLYLDPPYYVKGQEMLYANYYEPSDHAEVARVIRGIEQHWVVSYDDHADVRGLYHDCQTVAYDIAYSAAQRYRGREVAFFSDSLVVPDVTDPGRVSGSEMVRYLRGA